MQTPDMRQEASPSEARRVLAILWIVYVFNFVDRNILSILLEPIREELAVSDTAMGSLTGFAFALFYTFAGIPIARLADHRSRRAIMATGIAFWSLATAASGLVRSYVELAAARIAVGVGEAAATPAAHYLIADYFPPERRTRAIAIYNTGSNGGILLGLVLGGWLQQTYGWRVAFAAVGLPGLLVALIVLLLIREPPRGMADHQKSTGESPGLREGISILAGIPTYRHIAIAAGFYAISNYASIAWMPTFVRRVFGGSYTEIGMTLGVTLGFVGAAGTFAAGALCDRMLQRDLRWLLWVPAVGSVLSVPFFAVMCLAPSFDWGLPFYVASAFFGASFAAPTYALVQALAPLNLRATASAVLLFALNLIGLGMGPTVVGILNDRFAPLWGEDSIRYSLLLISLLNFWGMIHSLIAARTVDADIAAARLVTGGQAQA